MLTSDGALALRTILNFADRVFSVTIPGTSISFKAFFLSILVTCFVISLIKSLLGSADIVVDTVKSGYSRSEKSSKGDSK